MAKLQGTLIHKELIRNLVKTCIMIQEVCAYIKNPEFLTSSQVKIMF